MTVSYIRMLFVYWDLWIRLFRNLVFNILVTSDSVYIDITSSLYLEGSDKMKTRWDRMQTKLVLCNQQSCYSFGRRLDNKIIWFSDFMNPIKPSFTFISLKIWRRQWFTLSYRIDFYQISTYVMNSTHIKHHNSGSIISICWSRIELWLVLLLCNIREM